MHRHPALQPRWSERLRKVVPAEPGEARAALLGFTYFFVLLTSFAVLRPVRDAMGIASGIRTLPWLFTGTFIAMLVVVPVYAALTRRYPRNIFIPVVYRAFAVMSVAFYVLLSTQTAVRATAAAFFIWVSVYNIFVVSVFWSLMADVFRAEQAKRLYGFIAAGGTLGMIVGPIVTIALATQISAAMLLIVTATLLELAVVCARGLHRWAASQPDRRAESQAPVEGNLADGFLAVVRSRRLAAITLHVFLFSVTSTFLYVEQQRLVARAASTTDTQTAIFALVDLITQFLTLVIQLVVTKHILKRLGVTVALCALPAITALGSSVLVGSATLAVLVVVQAARRATQYAIERPGRESLFTGADRDVKYRTKNFMDTIVFRGGDALSVWGHSALAALGLGLVGFAGLMIPMSLAWLALASYIGHSRAPLGRAQEAT